MDERNFKTKQTRSSEDIISFYDQYAKTWDQRFNASASTEEFHQMRLNSFLNLAQLNKDITAIELGVGTGPYVKTIAGFVNRLICVDASREMLRVLTRKIENIDNIQIELLDITKPLFMNNLKADLVYFFGLIEHIIEIDIFIENCKRMLNDNGRLIVITPNGLCPWYYGVRNIIRSGKHCSSDNYYSRNSLRKIMMRHGLFEEQYNYWGFFPAGIDGIFFYILKYLGIFLEKTPLKKYSGGMSIKYKITE